ncbi:MAG TPA: hypothetical protein VF411_06030 [Bacteroidia bacterium]
MTLSVCNLCKTRPANKRNSHIIPKFLCSGLFEATKPRHSILIGKNGRGRKIQDTPKEDNILCNHCEKRIEIIETHFARIIKDIHNFSNLPDKFKFINTINQPQYLECVNIHPTLFKLFIYSLIWRASISNLIEFQKFKVSKLVEEELRVFLNANLTVSKKSLLDSLDVITDVPLYDNCFIKPLVKSDTSRGIFTAYNLDGSRHLLLIVDFAIFFFADEKLIDQILKVVSNKQNEKVIIGLGENTAWRELNQKVLKQMLGQKNYN